MSDSLVTLIERGTRVFGAGWQPTRVATAPGRLELLGNHVDYNGGLVLAGAINRVIHAIAAPIADAGTLQLLAPDISRNVATVSISQPTIGDADSATTPADYLAGIVQALREAHVPIRGGLGIVVAGDVPVGFGMSSSAALCVSLTLTVADADLGAGQIVAIARQAEHLTGAPVGAMDQSASVAGGVILFNGATNGMERLEPDLGEHVFAVANSGVHHALNESQYPHRVRESQEALEAIRKATGMELSSLGELTPAAWDGASKDGSVQLSPIHEQRVRHVVSEVERVRHGVQAIEHGDWKRFGEHMTASGRSSASDYDISHPVVEELVAALIQQPGVLGARMMGGGEGGPALALLRTDVVEQVREALDRQFFSPRDMDANSAFEVCAFGPGARIEDLHGTRQGGHAVRPQNHEMP